MSTDSTPSRRTVLEAVTVGGATCNLIVDRHYDDWVLLSWHGTLEATALVRRGAPVDTLIAAIRRAA